MSGYPVTGSFSRPQHIQRRQWCTNTVGVHVCGHVGGVGPSHADPTPVLQYIPKLSLSAIVLIAILKLIKLHEALFLWHVKRRDFLVFSSVVL